MSDRDDETIARPPSKRRRLDYDDPHSQSPADPKSPWTASRCLRLLRPLSSKVNLVKRTWSTTLQTSGDKLDRNDKRAEIEDLVDTEEWISDTSFVSKNKIRAKYSSKRKPRTDCHSEGIALKRQNSTKEKVPGELCLATPFISRHFGPRQAKPSPSTSELIEPKENRAKRRLKWGAVQKNAPASILYPFQPDLKDYQVELSQNLHKDLSSLLAATRPKHEQVRGARSLLSTCLRKLPTVIREEQTHVDHLEVHERYDVSAALYGELEERFSTSNSGWKPLRQLARAHGIEILCDCIRNGLLDSKVVGMLQCACVKNGAASEFRDIFWCLVGSTLPPSSNPRVQKDFLPLGRNHILHSDEDPQYQGQKQLHQEELCYLFSEASLPMELVTSSRVLQCLQLAIENIARRGHESDYIAASTNLVETVLQRALNVPTSSLSQEIHHLRLEVENFAKQHNLNFGSHGPDRQSRSSTDIGPSSVQDTIASLITITVAMEYLRLNSDCVANSLNSEPHIYIIPSLSLTIQQYRKLAKDSRWQNISAPSTLETSQILLGHYLLLDHKPGSDSGAEFPGITQEVLLETLEEIMQSKVDLETLSRVLTYFICSISRFCGRANRKPGFDYLKEFVSKLSKPDDYSVTTTSEARTFLRTVALEAAMAFAEQAGCKEAFEWASQIQLQLPIKSRSHDSRDSIKASGDQNGDHADKSIKKHTSFRWEDAISEWVAATPAKSIHRPICCQPVQDSSPDTEDSTTEEQEAILQISPKPRRFLGPNTILRNRRTARKKIREEIRKEMFVKESRSLNCRIGDECSEKTSLSNRGEDDSSKYWPRLQSTSTAKSMESSHAHWQPKTAGITLNDDSDELSFDHAGLSESIIDRDGALEPCMGPVDINQSSLDSTDDDIDELSKDLKVMESNERQKRKLNCSVRSHVVRLEAQGHGILENKLNRKERDALASDDESSDSSEDELTLA